MLSENHPQRLDGVDIYTVYSEETRLLKDWGSVGRIVGFDFGGDSLPILRARMNPDVHMAEPMILNAAARATCSWCSVSPTST